MLTVNLLRAARSCPVKSMPPIVLSRRTSPHPIQRTRGCGADGGEPTARGALLHESELARTDPDPQFLHRPMRYDIGLPSPVI